MVVVLLLSLVRQDDGDLERRLAFVADEYGLWRGCREGLNIYRTSTGAEKRLDGSTASVWQLA